MMYFWAIFYDENNDVIFVEKYLSLRCAFTRSVNNLMFGKAKCVKVYLRLKEPPSHLIWEYNKERRG